MADRIQQRHDTAANWNAANPILLEGEMGLITDTNQYKVGDGETRWNNLPLLGGAFVGNEINNLNTVTT